MKVIRVIHSAINKTTQDFQHGVELQSIEAMNVQNALDPIRGNRECDTNIIPWTCMDLWKDPVSAIDIDLGTHARRMAALLTCMDETVQHNNMSPANGPLQRRQLFSLIGSLAHDLGHRKCSRIALIREPGVKGGRPSDENLEEAMAVGARDFAFEFGRNS
jgi:hypothetical protein